MQGGFFVDIKKEKLAIKGGTPVLSDPLPSSLLGILDVGDEEKQAVMKVLDRKTMFRFLNSNEVSESAQLEKAYRDLCGVDYALALGGGGTGALICGLTGLGIGSGDEVIIPAYTYIATAAACLSVGAIPVIAEIDESLTLDPIDLERKITAHTKAVIPVHMRGLPCDMDSIMAVAEKHNLKVLEDVAQANGGSYKGRRLGSIGDAGAFSLQHYKVITAGEGGILTTRSEKVFKRAAVKHDSAMQFWQADESWESFAGENYRMCELGAALGLVQFGRLEKIISETRRIKTQLTRGIQGLKLVQPLKENDSKGDIGIALCFLLPTAELAKEFSAALKEEGVSNGTMYDGAIPDRHIYPNWDYVMEKRTSDPYGWPWTAARREIEYTPDMCPRTLDILGRCLSLSITPKWTETQINGVIEAIRKVDNGLS
jgi:dTDP-4-amino-4,6-dideoxygalactose transaminase